jgi:hypothetical protein
VSDAGVEEGAGAPPDRPHARERVGVIAGVLLGLLTLLSLIALAAMGFQPALGMLVVFFVGALIIAGGVRLHGPRR